MAGIGTPELTVDDLAAVQSKAWSARHKWYNIGLQLGLKADDLDCIQMSDRDSANCFTEMLKQWLRQGSIEKTWDKLIKALQSETVNYGTLAKSITIQGESATNWVNHDPTPEHHNESNVGSASKLNDSQQSDQYVDHGAERTDIVKGSFTVQAINEIGAGVTSEESDLMMFTTLTAHEPQDPTPTPHHFNMNDTVLASLDRILCAKGLTRGDLNRPVKVAHLYRVAPRIRDWKRCAALLGIGQDIIDAVDEEERNVKYKKIKVFSIWQELHGNDATYLMLAKILVEMGRRDLVEDLINLYLSMPKESPWIESIPDIAAEKMTKILKGIRSMYSY